MRVNLIILGFIFVMAACTKDPDFVANKSSYEKIKSWTKVSYTRNSAASFYERDNAVVVPVGSNAYIVGGNNVPSFLSHTWKFEPSSKTLSVLGLNNDLPELLKGAIGFSIDNYICFGTGIGSVGFTNSLYVKNTQSNASSSTWSPIQTVFGNSARFMGTARSNAVSFTIGKNVYVGLGVGASGYLKDFYCFNTDLKSWKKVADFTGSGRQDAVSFVINNKAYVGTGYNNGYLKDFYEYNPISDSWRKIADLPDLGRDDAVGFSLSSRGYVGLGWNDTKGVLSDFWQYNPFSNKWIVNTDIGVLGRFGANAWVINNEPYIGFGSTGTSVLDEIWQANK
ncbi:MAG: kelch repeat-containing protein [Bacteroidota bacterium]|nr:kelch repeat-containing protein [Bacteroidota bacterium]